MNKGRNKMKRRILISSYILIERSEEWARE
jgi:hypothetical protein